MRPYGWPLILTVAGIGGGLFLTLLSGLYTEKPFILDAVIIYFGFPCTWFQAGRSTWVPNSRWYYCFFWQGFLVDFMIYGLLTTLAVYFYFRTASSVRKLFSNVK